MIESMKICIQSKDFKYLYTVFHCAQPKGKFGHVIFFQQLLQQLFAPSTSAFLSSNQHLCQQIT